MGSCRSYLTGKTVSLSTLLECCQALSSWFGGQSQQPNHALVLVTGCWSPTKSLLMHNCHFTPRLRFQQNIKKRSAEPCRGKFELGIGQCVRPHHGLQSYDPEVTVALEIHTQSHWGRSHVMQNYTGKTFGPESHMQWQDS